MALAAVLALIHDLMLTAGVYSLVGFEVSPSTVVGLLTILGFSLYDTVVVFDKVAENSKGILSTTRMTYPEAANLAVNQTLMRSINTSIIGLLPVAGLLFVGAGLLGVGTLEDLALVLFVGMLTGAYSSLFLATPWLVDFKLMDPALPQPRRAGDGAPRQAVAPGRDRHADVRPPQDRGEERQAGREGRIEGRRPTPKTSTPTRPTRPRPRARTRWLARRVRRRGSVPSRRPSAIPVRGRPATDRAATAVAESTASHDRRPRRHGRSTVRQLCPSGRLADVSLVEAVAVRGRCGRGAARRMSRRSQTHGYAARSTGRRACAGRPGLSATGDRVQGPEPAVRRRSGVP